MPRLQSLATAHPSTEHTLPPNLARIVTPFNTQAWAAELASHPDAAFKAFILDGISQGFRIGHNPQALRLASQRRNMASAREYPQVVGEYIRQELQLGRMASTSPYPEVAKACHISPFGVIPKRSKPGKWRLILDLSSPHGHSVNEGINPESARVAYISIDEVIRCITTVGQGTIMAKIDIKQAYRNVSVHPADRHLLGMTWQGETLIDLVLPFGLRSAPIIFTAVADAIQWIAEKRSATHLFHYLDDFLTIGPAGSLVCLTSLQSLTATCNHLGVPLELDKTEGPATCLTFLGLELDTNLMIMRLPDEKLKRLKQLLRQCLGNRSLRKRQLLSLVGILHHASKAIRQGRPFIRRLIDLSMATKHLDSWLRLNVEARSDIAWWYAFAEVWNGTSFFYEVSRANPQIHVVSDASSSWGCGALYSTEWFQIQWPKAPSDHISTLEMIPIVAAAIMWGAAWKKLSICFHTDNSAVVAVLNQGSVCDPMLMHLMRCLSFIAAQHQFIFSATHIRGVENVLADALSRNNLTLFRSLSPQASQLPTTIPQAVKEFLIVIRPDWTSPTWMPLWNSFMKNP